MVGEVPTLRAHQVLFNDVPQLRAPMSMTVRVSGDQRVVVQVIGKS